MIAWADAAPLTVLGGVALAALLVAASTRRWRQGAPAPVRVLAGLAAMPRRYLVDLHDVVARKPANARFHMLTAGGFVGSLLLLLLLLVPSLPRWPVWSRPRAKSPVASITISTQPRTIQRSFSFTKTGSARRTSTRICNHRTFRHCCHV